MLYFSVISRELCRSELIREIHWVLCQNVPRIGNYAHNQKFQVMPKIMLASGGRPKIYMYSNSSLYSDSLLLLYSTVPGTGCGRMNELIHSYSWGLTNGQYTHGP
eukprot:COSAG02_NODE_33378_length_500_cov_436.107232_1_plen_104_part_01